MKKLSLLLLAFTISGTLLAQKGKNKDKKENPKTEARDKILGKDKKSPKKDDAAIWEGTKDKDGGGPKPSKNQPAKVREAFRKDYPNATNVSWSKYRGDWTASFGNGLVRSTAVYHANGERKDTRTLIEHKSLPQTIIDIFKKRNAVEMGNIVKIEVPQAVKDVFRIRTVESGKVRFEFYDAGGQEVKYEY